VDKFGWQVDQLGSSGQQTNLSGHLLRVCWAPAFALIVLACRLLFDFVVSGSSSPLVIMAGMPRKLVVEVLAAKALMPKDGEGSSNAYCVVICSTCVVHSFLLLCS
jgi:hypothetical protein